MNSTKSSRKGIERVSSDSATLSFDLYSNLTYMSALSMGEAPRDMIFQQVMTRPYKTALYFKQVYLLTKKLGFEYGRSFQLVSKRAGAETIKSLLLRFAGSIASGESEHEFLTQEARVEREQYISQYQRSLETLQKWGDAYAALLVSVSLIVVVAMIPTMLYDIGDAFVMMLAGTMFFMSMFGAWIIYKTAPVEVKSYKSRKGPKERQRVKPFLITLGPLGVLLAGILVISGLAGLGLLTFGLCLMPAGIYAFMDDMKVDAIDQEMSKFIRSLGSVAESLDSTLTAAMAQIDRRSLGNLDPYVKRLQSRLRNQITPALCWERFKDETGSELVARSTSMFVDGMALGGSPEKVGRIASDYALSIGLLRQRRTVTTTPFAYLTVPLHGAMTALLIFVMEIMAAFNGKLIEAIDELAGQAGSVALQIPNLPVFQPKDMTQNFVITMGAVLILTVANTMAAKFATGGHNYKLAFYGSIMCTLSGLNMFLIPPIAEGLMSR